MDKSSYYLMPDASGTAFNGSGYTPDGTFPAEAIPCTQAQAQQFQSLVPDGNGGLTSAPESVLISAAQSAQIAIIDAAYLAAVTTPVAFTTGAGVASTYQADPVSQQTLSRAMQTYKAAGSVPSGFYWRSAGNTNVAFTLADLEGLDAAMMAQGWAAFQQKVTLKEDIAAATTVSAVQAVVWP
jgi:hypothetical protein